jgi:hypothetical protein
VPQRLLGKSRLAGQGQLAQIHDRFDAVARQQRGEFVEAQPFVADRENPHFPVSI